MGKVLVTGGAGFIGSHLVDKLVEEKNKVIVLDNLSTGKEENLNSGADFYKVDIRKLKEIKPLFDGVDYVFHLAALPRIQISIDDPVTTNDINLNGTLNVLVASRDAGAKKVVYSASSSAYGLQDKLPWREDMTPAPFVPYALQKYAGELYCRVFSHVYSLSTVCLRYFNIYGKRQSDKGAYCPLMAVFTRQRLNGDPLTIVGEGTNTRDYTGVADAVSANILAMKSGKVKKGEVINIGRGKNYSINAVAKMIGGPTINIEPRIEVKNSLADNSKARELLGWEPQVNLPEWIEAYKKELGI